MRGRSTPTTTDHLDPGEAPPHPGSTGRRVRRRRPLPSSRAVVGGLVVAVAMLASFAVAGRSRGAPKGRVVVARHDVHLGARLHADDLGVVAVDLPGRAAAETFSSPADLDGAVALAPLRAGDVIDRSAVSTDPGEPGGAQLSFPLDRDRALDGDLDLGEQLDLLATFGSGETARTQVVARRVRLVAVDTDGGGLEGAGKLVVTVELPDSTDLLAVTHAAQVGDVTLARAG